MKISMNTDLKIKGENIHVQTEDWGLQHKKIVSRVFKHGQMIKSFEVPYNEIDPSFKDSKIKTYVESFHNHVIDFVYEEM